MTEIGNVTVRLDAVISDEQYREAMGAVGVANERMDQLEAENAKLRECLQDIANTINSGFGIDYGWMLSHIRALGIEVDA